MAPNSNPKVANTAYHLSPIQFLFIVRLLLYLSIFLFMDISFHLPHKPKFERRFPLLNPQKKAPKRRGLTGSVLYYIRLQWLKKSMASSSAFSCFSSSGDTVWKGVRLGPRSRPMSFMMRLPPTMLPRKWQMTLITSCA